MAFSAGNRRASPTSSPVSVQAVCDKGGGGGSKGLQSSGADVWKLPHHSICPLWPQHLLNTPFKWKVSHPSVRPCSPRHRQRLRFLRGNFSTSALTFFEALRFDSLACKEELQRDNFWSEEAEWVCTGPGCRSWPFHVNPSLFKRCPFSSHAASVGHGLQPESSHSPPQLILYI